MKIRGRMVHNKTNVEFFVGDEVQSSDGQLHEIMGWSAPHKPSSSGRISVRILGTNYVREYYPHVFDLKIVDFE